MKTLLVLRHAKSSWSDPSLPDHERPLNKRGRRDAPRMGQLIARNDLVPDVVLTSTAVRARETARLVVAAAGTSAIVMQTEALYHGDPDSLMASLAEHGGGADRVMLVGHNPGLEELVTALTGQVERLPTATLARIDVEIAAWEELGAGSAAKLIDVWRPKDVLPES